MSGDESFLARWARRKRGPAPTARGQPKPENTPDGAASEAAAASVAPEVTLSLFDPTSLPPIEAIGAGSDIRPFLAAGVPADLTRAALRRAWSADPAIRDFIGLSENSWDFNAPGGVPGFGSLTAEDARRLPARVTGEKEASDTAPPAAERLSEDQTSAPASGPDLRTPGSVPDQTKLGDNTDADHPNPMPSAETSNIAVRHEMDEREARPPLPRRRHGGALPD
ncbi:MAG TPA: DUF3306 domain-containing protein [Xanthobacteraceae bacterium]|jgi:Protein of unknown function (DUF3306)|nr:DUF3306 domain-containing protein [Xanthobacteraceae bacterium]